MTVSKRKDKQTVKEEQPEMPDADIMVRFAEIVSHNILERDLSCVESFELYAHTLRAHLHSNPDIFKTRFSAGYSILLEELGREPIT